MDAIDHPAPHSLQLIAVIELEEEALDGLGSVDLPEHEFRPAIESPRGYVWLEFHVRHPGTATALACTAREALLALARAEEAGTISGLRLISGSHWLEDAEAPFPTIH
jgi:hypothetical protein